MTNANRIDAREAQRKIASQAAILVCAYDDEDKCRQLDVDGSITLAEFVNQRETLPRDLEVIFFCN